MAPKHKKSKKSSGKSGNSSQAQDPIDIVMPEDFPKIVTDMCNDFTTTFPEYSHLWNMYTKEAIIENPPIFEELYHYCLGVFPERFFDILYKNQDIFEKDATQNVCFLPNVDFRILFHCDGVSDNTKNVMWNYLQLILFTIIGNIRDKAKFGESTNIFDGIDENDLFEKLSDTMKNMTDFFQNMENDSTFTGGEADGEKEQDQECGDPDDQEKGEENDFGGFKMPKFPKMPDIKELHTHLKALFDGKIGSLAKELAEEITGDLSSLLGDDMKDVKTTKDVLQMLIKDPKKISGIIQKISEKLKHKMSSGEISQEELMKEATDLLGKMKEMGGGMDQFRDMFKNMGIPIPKNAKIDMNALNRMTSHQSMRERLKKKMMEKKQAQQDAIMKMAASMAAQQQMPEDINVLYQQLGLDSNDGIEGVSTSGSNKKKKGKK